MRRYFSLFPLLAVIMLVGASPFAAADESGKYPAPGWYYLWAQCTQEPSTSDDPALCSNGVEGEWYQALAISSVFNRPDDRFNAHMIFKAEASRRFGFAVEASEVGPFASFQEAEQQIVTMLRANRRIEGGKLAVTAIPLQPVRLDDEPNDEERMSQPAPLPPVVESFRGGSAQLWHDSKAKACGLRLSDGTAIVPDLVTDLWGEDGEGCPRELVEGAGIYLFDVPRSGAVCGETGVCTELFDGEGHWIGVIEETPYPLIAPDLFRVWGIIRAGQWNERLYSIPERRILFARWPGNAPEEESRVVIGANIVIDDRPAIEINREFRNHEPDTGYFWLDTMMFEPAGATRKISE